MKEEKPATLNSSDELPVFSDLREAEAAAKNCQRCPLWERATQTVFGSGASKARLLFVGEQPGDVEDRTGLPFVGPAGRLLDRALKAAQIGRDLCYVTNAVKHFKWEPFGQRRLHKKPTSRELQACRPWLQVEIELFSLRSWSASALAPPRRFLAAQSESPTSAGNSPLSNLWGRPV